MKTSISVKKKIPFAFALEELDALSPTVKPMFGGFIVYIGDKLVLFLYDQEKWTDFKGVSLATTPENYRSLAKVFSSEHDAEPQKIGKHPWLLLPSSATDFEGQVLKACEMILNGDPIIGRAPEEKKLKPAKKETNRKKKANP